MPPDMSFLHDIVVLFGVALVVIAASSRLRVPPVVGFLLTGVVVGPHGLALIRDIERVRIFAELGVVFLLFIIGLELSPARLKRLGRIILIGGSAQAAATILVVAGLGLLLQYPLREALFFSFLIALSSTAIVLKLYSERRELETPHGEVAMGILLFQDFLIVPLLLVVPVLAGKGGASVGDFLLRFGGGLAVVGAVAVAGRYLVPHFLHLIVHTRIRELFVLGALFACLGAGVLTETLGFSLALGAFIAGLVIAESDYRYQVLAETASFRDVFNSMFFISVGMLLSLQYIAEHALLVLAVGSGIVAIKAAVVVLAVAALAFPWRIRIVVALGLAQVSEFSFVLIHAGFSLGLLDGWHYQLAIAASVFTMLLTPLLVVVGPHLAARLVRDGAAPDAGGAEEHYHSRVALVGFGLSGRHLAQALKEAGVSYAIVELNGRTVRQARAEGEPILYGDSTRLEIQERLGIPEAEVAIFAMADRAALKDSVSLARHLNPELFIVARTRALAETEELKSCGADVVVVEDMEASVKLLAIALTHLNLGDQVVREQVRRARKDAYEVLRQLPGALAAEVVQKLETEATGTFALTAAQVGGGRTLADLDLGGRAGVGVVALHRGEHTFVHPEPGTALEEGDVLVVTGRHEAIERARAHLQGEVA